MVRTLQFVVLAAATLSMVPASIEAGIFYSASKSSYLHYAGERLEYLTDVQPAFLNADNVTLTFADLPSATDGDVTIKVILRGDFDNANEYAKLSLDGYSLGTLLDDNANNDLFDHSQDLGWLRTGDTPAPRLGDVGLLNRYNQSTAVIPRAKWSELAADGKVDLYFDFTGADVQVVEDNAKSVFLAFAAAEITYAIVPEPSSLVIFAIGLSVLGFAAMLRNRQRPLSSR